MRIELPGINIQQPWSRLLIDGKKTVETRRYPIAPGYAQQNLWLIETPGKEADFQARVIGIIYFSGYFQYESTDQFDRDFSRHLVDRHDPNFGWVPGSRRFGWEIQHCFPIKPIPVTQRKGWVYTKNLSFETGLE